MTTVLLIVVLASVIGIRLARNARKRAQQRAADEMQARLRAARKSRVPAVSANLKGVTASQTLPSAAAAATAGAAKSEHAA